MPRPKRHCRDCGITDVMLSRKGYCTPCFTQRMYDAGNAMINKEGDQFENYKKAMIEFLSLNKSKGENSLKND